MRPEITLLFSVLHGSLKVRSNL